MMFTFKNDNDVIVITLEKVISHSKKTQQIFVAQCVWLLASVNGLELGLIIQIDHLGSREAKAVLAVPQLVRTDPENSDSDCLHPEVHPGWIHQISSEREVSATPRDLTEDLRVDCLLQCAEQFVEVSRRA